MVRTSRTKTLALALTILWLAGCSASPAGGFTFFPSGHPLLDSADRLRRMAPDVRPVPRELQKTVLAQYVVEPGDGLLVEPVSFESTLRFPTDQIVLPDGTIDLAQYGRPVVAGRTIPEIEALVEEALGEDAEPGAVNVRLIDPESKVYYVMGEVSAPGAYPFVGRETVLDAIVAAGGLTERAAPCDVILVRPTPPDGCRVVLPVCYRQIVQLGDTLTNYQMMPGDRVFVATRSCWEGLIPGQDKKPCPLCCRCQYPCPDVGYATLNGLSARPAAYGEETLPEVAPDEELVPPPAPADAPPPDSPPPPAPGEAP